jgi:hypothetical protein
VKMRLGRRGWVLLSAIGLFVAAGRRVGGSGGDNTIFSVVVADSQGHRAIQGARSHVVGCGRIRVAGSTSGLDGEIRLPTNVLSTCTTLILVSRPGYFIGGVRWAPGFSERYLHLAKRTRMRAEETQRPGVVTVAVQGLEVPVKGARVFLLLANGDEIPVGLTDDAGRLALPSIEGSPEPKYIFAEHPTFFLCGTEWLGSAGNYRISLAGLAVM